MLVHEFAEYCSRRKCQFLFMSFLPRNEGDRNAKTKTPIRMTIPEIINGKSSKAKEKVEQLAKKLFGGSITTSELIRFAKTAKDSSKAACLEALEFVSKKDPKIVNAECLKFVSDCLDEKAPRVKWEAAKVIGNVAHIHSLKLDEAIVHLLNNTEHPGTVVRWSTAYAITQIVKTKEHDHLIPVIENLSKREENNGTRKIYLDAIKNLKK
jgi:hypothetical protein